MSECGGNEPNRKPVSECCVVAKRTDLETCGEGEANLLVTLNGRGVGAWGVYVTVTLN